MIWLAETFIYETQQKTYVYIFDTLPNLRQFSTNARTRIYNGSFNIIIIYLHCYHFYYYNDRYYYRLIILKCTCTCF